MRSSGTCMMYDRSMISTWNYITCLCIHVPIPRYVYINMTQSIEHTPYQCIPPTVLPRLFRPPLHHSISAYPRLTPIRRSAMKDILHALQHYTTTSRILKSRNSLRDDWLDGVFTSFARGEYHMHRMATP